MSNLPTRGVRWQDEGSNLTLQVSAGLPIMTVEGLLRAGSSVSIGGAAGLEVSGQADANSGPPLLNN